MSNIFKAKQPQSAENTTRNISIRNLHASVELEQSTEITMDEILTERDRIFAIERRALEDEKREIDDMRRIAADDIAAMQAAWADEKLELQQQAYDEAFQIGFTEGREKVLVEMAASVKQANGVTEKSQENAQQYQASQERVILELAMSAAERIIGVALEENHELYLEVVKKALKEVREMKEIKIFVSLDYYELISDNRAELAAIFPPEVPFLIFANEDFETTECYIETNHGRIVVSIDDQLTHLREQLIEILESRD